MGARMIRQIFRLGMLCRRSARLHRMRGSGRHFARRFCRMRPRGEPPGRRRRCLPEGDSLRGRRRGERFCLPQSWQSPFQARRFYRRRTGLLFRHQPSTGLLPGLPKSWHREDQAVRPPGRTLGHQPRNIFGQGQPGPLCAPRRRVDKNGRARPGGGSSSARRSRSSRRSPTPITIGPSYFSDYARSRERSLTTVPLLSCCQSRPPAMPAGPPYFWT